MGLIKEPVSLMRLVDVDDISDITRAMKALNLSPSDLIAETKWNGWLAQAVGGRLYTRRGKDITAKFPHIASQIAPFTEEHLVGELVYFTTDGVMDEPSVTKIAGTKDDDEAVEKLNTLPGTFRYIIFDVLAAAGHDVTPLPLKDRRRILEDCLSGSGLDVSEQQPFEDWQKVYEAGVKAGGDGVVFKNLHASYDWRPLGESEARPYGVMWKLKPVHTDDFVVYDLARGPKGRVLLVFGQYHGAALIPVGQVNNLSREMERHVIDLIKEGPFVVELEYLSRFPGSPGALQHPRLLRIREDKDPEDATLPENHAPDGGSMGVSLPGYQSYWIKPDGEVLSFPWQTSHDDVARKEGFDSWINALQAGWIRAFDGSVQNAGIQVWDIGNPLTLDLVGGFIESLKMQRPGLQTVVIDSGGITPSVSFSIYPEEFDKPSILEDIESGIRRALM